MSVAEGKLRARDPSHESTRQRRNSNVYRGLSASDVWRGRCGAFPGANSVKPWSWAGRGANERIATEVRKRARKTALLTPCPT